MFSMCRCLEGFLEGRNEKDEKEKKKEEKKKKPSGGRFHHPFLELLW